MSYKNKEQKEIYEFELEKQLIIISVPTIKKLLSFGKEGADALTLYNFYYYTAKWQGTNQPKATPSYCMNGLGWGEKRFKSADKILRDLNLVEKIAKRDKNNKIIGWYVRLNYIWTSNKEKELISETSEAETKSPEGSFSTRVENPPGGRQGTNALSVSNINALSDNNKNNIAVASATAVVENKNPKETLVGNSVEILVGDKVKTPISNSAENPVVSRGGGLAKSSAGNQAGIPAEEPVVGDDNKLAITGTISNTDGDIKGYSKKGPSGKKGVNNGEDVDSREIAMIINYFKHVSPLSYKDWFANKTERRAASELLKKLPADKLEILITQFLPRLNVIPYIPKDCKAFKPSELLRNLDKILAKIKEIQQKRSQEKINIEI
jgi:hypothetical protein